MTSRVQKGSTIFRPIAKSKPRQNPTSRQQSIVPFEQKFSVGQSASSLSFTPLPESIHVEADTDTADIFGDKNASKSSLKEVSADLPLQALPRASTIPPVLKPARSVPATLITISQQRPSRTNTPTHISPTPPFIPSEDDSSQSLPSSTSHTPFSDSENIPTPSIPPVAPCSQQSKEDVEMSEGNAEMFPSSDTNPERGPSVSQKSKKKDTDGKVPAKKKRKRSIPKGSEGPEDITVANTKEKKSRASSDGPRTRRSRGPSLPPYDPDADPGEEIDPTAITMATLCEDTGQGRVSSKAAEILSNHAAWKAKNKEKRARMKEMMEAKKYGRDEDGEGQPKDSSGSGAALNGVQPESLNTALSKSVGGGQNGFDYSEDVQTSRFNVQVRIGPNGETIIDEESLVVDRIEADDTVQYTHVTESDTTKFVNSGTYSKRYRGSRWSAEETELFYNALSQYGENYELIAYVLPGRDRKSCKNKFKAEDKKNHARINYCLNNRIPVDMKTLSRLTGKDFSGPVPDIRPLTPAPILVNEENTSTLVEDQALIRTEAKKRRSKKAALDDGVVIVGDVDMLDI